MPIMPSRHPFSHAENPLNSANSPPHPPPAAILGGGGPIGIVNENSQVVFH
jgi:hypothetical protein